MKIDENIIVGHTSSNNRGEDLFTFLKRMHKISIELDINLLAEERLKLENYINQEIKRIEDTYGILTFIKQNSKDNVLESRVTLNVDLQKVKNCIKNSEK